MTLIRQKLITLCLCNMFSTIQLSTRLNLGGFIDEGRDQYTETFGRITSSQKTLLNEIVSWYVGCMQTGSEESLPPSAGARLLPAGSRAARTKCSRASLITTRVSWKCNIMVGKEMLFH